MIAVLVVKLFKLVPGLWERENIAKNYSRSSFFPAEPPPLPMLLSAARPGQ